MSNERNEYTKKIIREAFYQVLSEKPFSKIKVQDVCEAASINRTSFYRYYKSLDHLCASIQNDLFIEIEQNALNPDGEVTRELGEKIKSMYKLQSSDNQILQQNTAETLDRYTELISSNSFKAEYFDDLDPEQYMKRLFIHAGITAVYHYWISTGMTVDSAKIAEFVIDLYSSAIRKK